MMKSSGLYDSWRVNVNLVPQDITTDSNNNIYIVGYDISWDRSLTLLKYESSGTLLWNKHFEDFIIYSPKIKTDSNNNLYLVCSFRNKTSQSYSTRSTLVKFNSSGDVQWQQIWDREEVNYISDIAIDPENYINIYGTWKSSDYSQGNIFIMKYNSSGALLWHHILEESNTLYSGWCLEIGSDNNYIVSGYSHNNSSIYWLRSYNISGDLQWTINTQFESFGLLALDSSDDVISLSLTWDNITHESKLLLVKYSKSGNLIWDYEFQSKFTNLFHYPGIPVSMIYQYGLTIDSYDNIYITWEIEIPDNAYKTDVLIVKVNKTGNYEDYLTWGGLESEDFMGIDVDSNTNVYLLTLNYLIKNPVSNNKSLYRTMLWFFFIFLFVVCCVLSLISVYVIIRQKIP